MPLTGTNYTRSAIFAPSNATAPSYNWSVTGGVISGSSTNSSVSFSFNAIGTQTLSLTVSNGCGNVTNSETFTVCNPITGVSIAGALSVTQNSTGIYSVSWASGSPVSYSWGVAGTGVSIIGSHTGSSENVQFGSTGTALICVDLYDYDGTNYSACVTVNQTGTGCVALTSCSIN